MTTFEQFLTSREQASTEFIDGDADPLLAISATDRPATIFGPDGTCVHDPASVNSTNAAGAANFEPGGDNRFELAHSGVDGDLAYWVGTQHSKVRVRGHDEPVPFDLRVTELFRREEGEWKLFHRHADRLATNDTAGDAR